MNFGAGRWLSLPTIYLIFLVTSPEHNTSIKSVSKPSKRFRSHNFTNLYKIKVMWSAIGYWRLRKLNQMESQYYIHKKIVRYNSIFIYYSHKAMLFGLLVSVSS